MLSEKLLEIRSGVAYNGSGKSDSIARTATTIDLRRVVGTAPGTVPRTLEHESWGP